MRGLYGHFKMATQCKPSHSIHVFGAESRRQKEPQGRREITKICDDAHYWLGQTKRPIRQS